MTDNTITPCPIDAALAPLASAGNHEAGRLWHLHRPTCEHCTFRSVVANME